MSDQFEKIAKGTTEILQSVEDALIDAGWGEMLTATEHGAFDWKTTERWRAESRERRAEIDALYAQIEVLRSALEPLAAAQLAEVAATGNFVCDFCDNNADDHLHDCAVGKAVLALSSLPSPPSVGEG